MHPLFRSPLLYALLGALALSSVALAATASVTIQNFAFNPSTVRINPGDAVSWRNADTVPHSIHWTSGGLTDSLPLVSGQSFAQSFANAGVYSYICGIHGSSMSGNVLVGNVQATTPPPSTPPPVTPTPTIAPPPTPTASRSPSPTPSQSATPTPSASPTPSTPRPSGSPSPTPTASPLAAPASQANTLIGLALVLIGVAILAGAFWWRFGTG